MSYLDLRERFIDYANDDAAAMKAAMDGRSAETWTSLPGIIKSVNFGAITCEVQPTIQSVVIVNGERQNTSLPQLLDVPVVYPHGGGYSLTFPLGANNAEDEVLTIFSARCIDNWWQHGGVQPQFEQRMHDLSDGFAIPGPYSQKNKISNVSTTTAQFRSDDGDLFVELDLPNKKVRTVTPQTEIVQDDNAKKITMTAGSTQIIQDGTANRITLTAGTTTLVIDGNAGTITTTGQSAFDVTAPIINLN